jgi:cell cycle related kinase
VPVDILISSNGDVKLADFGLAKVYDVNDPLTMSHQVATRFYRAPELLFASRSYGFEVDIWAVGAIIAEIMTLAPLFPGSNDIDQMFKVFQIMGTPDICDWPVSPLLACSCVYCLTESIVVYLNL